MNFYDYLGITPVKLEQYRLDGLIQRQKHNTLPLDIYCYGRKAVFDNHWDAVTSKCRGVVVHRATGEVIARPFEKFHNHGSPMAMQGGSNTYNGLTESMIKTQPVIWEKLDGFLCTLYRWDGIDYIASKGSFHSIHAKWATSWYRANVGLRGRWPEGYTPVFEGLCRDLRIVVDYGDREELVLLALVNIKTGGELSASSLGTWAKVNRLATPKLLDNMTLAQAREESLKDRGLGTDEGYVLTWPDPLGAKPPIRLKMKFIEYLRLHRMVCGVSPWRIWEALSSGVNNAEFDEWVNSSTPWFKNFVQKWAMALTSAYAAELADSTMIYEDAVNAIGIRPGIRSRRGASSPAEVSTRKAFAEYFTSPQRNKYAVSCFKLLDRQDPKDVIWSHVEGMTKGVAPMRDAQFS